VESSGRERGVGGRRGEITSWVTIDGLKWENGRVIQGYSPRVTDLGMHTPTGQSKVWSIRDGARGGEK